MSFHLEKPYLTSTRYSRKPYRKWASSAAKQKAEREAQEWEALKRSWNRQAPNFSNKASSAQQTHREAFRPLQLGSAYPPGREPNRIPSRPDTPGAVASRAEDKVYTGTKMKGIGVLHKSNSVPIFTDDEAVDIAHMRR